MAALRAHPFFEPINWSTLWTDPAPPLETGLVRREGPPAGSPGDYWEDVGQEWDDLVRDGDGSSDEGTPYGDDGIGWAPGAEPGETYAAARTVREYGYVPPEEVGPEGELPDYARERINTPAPLTPAAVAAASAISGDTVTATTMEDGSIRTASATGGMAGTGPTGPVKLVQGNGAVQFQLPVASHSLDGSAMSTPTPEIVPSNGGVLMSNGDADSISTTSAGTTTDGSPDRQSEPEPSSGGGADNTVGASTAVPVGVPAPRDRYATSSSDGSPVEKLGAALDAMKLNRGRHRTRSPMRISTQPPLEPDWCVFTLARICAPKSNDCELVCRSSVLISGESMLFDSEVEETVMKRRTSRLLIPLPVAPRRPKVRQLVLTSHRLVCLKQMKNGRGIGIKSEYGFRPSEKEKEKEREKEERCMVTGVALKGGREFVVFSVRFCLTLHLLKSRAALLILFTIIDQPIRLLCRAGQRCGSDLGFENQRGNSAVQRTAARAQALTKPRQQQ
jgi:3-phosphoinositide dependent protein kinase-1